MRGLILTVIAVYLLQGCVSGFSPEYMMEAKELCSDKVSSYNPRTGKVICGDPTSP